ncbi:hypothetical protein STXM2123_3713 [Streptomyces sp. F-3]|uniref:Uncharacterized protein n=1 Tax=Streptomyces thermogriseus TaxID=75292 RepID=A0ABP4DGS4_9ACTN|nr:hypothetical protein STXM2123_3713 [Streptomyces sp. F-3]
MDGRARPSGARRFDAGDIPIPSAVRAPPAPEAGGAAFRILPAVPRESYGKGGVGTLSHAGHPLR